MFVTFNQNSSFGYFDYLESGLSHFVIIEADNLAEAVQKATKIGMYFDGVDSGVDCPCCGDRWNEPYIHESDETPHVYNQEVYPGMQYSSADETSWMDQYEGFIHYKDGRVEGFWYGRNPAPTWV